MPSSICLGSDAGYKVEGKPAKRQPAKLRGRVHAHEQPVWQRRAKSTLTQPLKLRFASYNFSLFFYNFFVKMSFTGYVWTLLITHVFPVKQTSPWSKVRTLHPPLGFLVMSGPPLRSLHKPRSEAEGGPLHACPELSVMYPRRQLQRYEPSTLLHAPPGAHRCGCSRHSSTSGKPRRNRDENM